MPKSNSRSSKPPLRGRNLPPSFFQEPEHVAGCQQQHNATSCAVHNHYDDVTFNIDDITNDITVDCMTLYQNDTLESILDETEFPDILAEQHNCDLENKQIDRVLPTTQTDGRTLNMACRQCQTEYQDFSESSCDYSPKAPEQRLLDERCFQNFDNRMENTVLNTSECLQTYTFSSNHCHVTGNSLDENEYKQSEFQNGGSVDGFLPFLNEPLETYIATPICETQADVTSFSRDTSLPTFPQAFCSNHDFQNGTHFLDNMTRNVSEWGSSQVNQSCYTYL